MNRKIISILCLFLAVPVYASEGFDYGYIKNLSYRGDYVTFNVETESGANLCAACPTDPGLRGTKACWIHESETVQISILLSAHARGKKVAGRVAEFATSCGVYQMTVEN